MQTLPWLLTLLLSSLQATAVRAADQRTRCASSTVTEGERAVITYHLRPDTDYSTSLLYIRRDQEPGQILICDGTCDVRNGHFRSAGIMGTTLTLEAPVVTQEEQGCYYLFAVVDGQQQPPCACNLTVVAKAAVPPPAEDGSNVTIVVGVIVSGLVLFAIGVGLLLYVLLIRKRKNSKKPDNTLVREDEEKAITKRNGITAGDDHHTTTESEAKGETASLLDKDASDPTPILVPSSKQDTVQGLREDGDGSDRNKASEAQGETATLLDNDVSEPTLTHPLSPQPDTGISSTSVGPRADELASAVAVRSALLKSADGVYNSHIQAKESSVDATQSCVDTRPSSLQETKVPGRAKRVSSDVVGNTDATAPDVRVDFNGHSWEERPASLLEDKGKVAVVIFLINSLRSTATKLKEVMHQHPNRKGVGQKHIFITHREQTLSQEMHRKWESLRREIARRVSFKLTDDKLQETAKKLLKGAPIKTILVPELLIKFREFRHEISLSTLETDKTFATFPADQDFNVVCLCLSLTDMVSMSIRMRDGRKTESTDLLERVASELERQTQYFEKHRVSVW